MKVLCIVGARPQFIKAAPLSKALAKTNHTEFLVHTGQHYDEEMSGVFFKRLQLREPDINLDVGSGTHAEQIARMLPPLEGLVQEQQPDWVLVYGDTNSTLAGALVAPKLQIPLAHVEAGLRSYNRTMPEEINRVLVDHVSTLLLCPTPISVRNLAQEGITDGVVMTGDIMVDALLSQLENARHLSTIHSQSGIRRGEPYAVATIHRPANADYPHRLLEIIAGLSSLPMPTVFSVHPRTRKSISAHGIQPRENIHFVPPLDYLDMLALLDRANVLITDSGGLQKEAYILKVPCVTVRPDTEWLETVESGWNRLVDANAEGIRQGVCKALDMPPVEHPDYYGTGGAAERIVAALETFPHPA